MGDAITIGADGSARCAWPGDDELYVQYHDQEWGTQKVTTTSCLKRFALKGFRLVWLG